MSRAEPKFDVLIVGTGYSGSLLGWILSKQGKSVLLVDRAVHPRFAIGESSTPTADFLLAHLADRWGLAELAPLACWGSWKQIYPQLGCGKKRGFSYYQHLVDKDFVDEDGHSRSLLVAASMQDCWSDTHWLREDVDAFLTHCALESGCIIEQGCEIESAHFDPAGNGSWQIRLRRIGSAEILSDSVAVEETQPIRVGYVVDASGRGAGFSRFVQNRPDSDWMLTRTEAVFGHFEGVAPFAPGIDPLAGFSGDDAAQHHFLESGWVWMLRMDRDICSVGLVTPLRPGKRRLQPNQVEREMWFRHVVGKYPSLKAVLSDAKLVNPVGGMGSTGLMSRCNARAWGPGWLALPVSYGFVDPLHSTGIAHGLSGVVRVAELFASNSERDARVLAEYDRQLRDEIQWIDRLVAGVYAVQPSFDLVIAVASLYFAAAVKFEKQLAVDPQVWCDGFLQCRDPHLRSAVSETLELLVQHRKSGGAVRNEVIIDTIHKHLATSASTEFLTRTQQNRIRHSAAPKYATRASLGLPDSE